MHDRKNTKIINLGQKHDKWMTEKINEPMVMDSLAVGMVNRRGGQEAAACDCYSVLDAMNSLCEIK